MSRQWQFSTVQDFLRRCNWQGTAPSIPSETAETISDHRSQSNSKASSWHCETVQTFFSRSNWDGQRPLISTAVAEEFSLAESQDSPLILASTLPVKSFFKFFIWEAQPVIAAVPELNSPDDQAEKNDLNLSDFSDLF